MDLETSKPERQIVAVDLAKGKSGRLGIKISDMESTSTLLIEGTLKLET